MKTLYFWSKPQEEKPAKEVKKLITSKDIQEDLCKSFDEVMKEFNLKESKETEIEKLNSKIELFTKENEEIYKKIEVLKNLGLTSTPCVTQSMQKLNSKLTEIRNKINQISQEILNAERLNKLSSDYSLKYPCYKFIDDNTMFKIMEKYNLVLGEAFMYGREIPSENLEIINYFASEVKESEKIFQLVCESYGGMNDYHFIKKPKIKDTSDYNLSVLSRVYKSVKKEFTVSKFKIVAPESHFIVPTYEIRNYRGYYEKAPLLSLGKDREYKFDISKVKEVEAERVKVLDPIACLEVEGGYIIMTAWDKEAEIPEIKNVTLN